MIELILVFSLIVGLVALGVMWKAISEGDKWVVPLFIAILLFVIGILLMIEELFVP